MTCKYLQFLCIAFQNYIQITFDFEKLLTVRFRTVHCKFILCERQKQFILTQVPQSFSDGDD